MEEYICELNRDLRQAMVKKFGMSVNLDELQETILNRFAFMIRTNFEDIKREYAKKAEESKVSYILGLRVCLSCDNLVIVCTRLFRFAAKRHKSITKPKCSKSCDVLAQTHFLFVSIHRKISH